MSLLATVNGRGLLSGRPTAIAANEGYLYYATDSGSGALYRSNGSSWDAYSSGGLADQGGFTYLDGTVAAAPATPASGKLRIYAKSGKVLAVKDDTGAETVMGAGGVGGALVLLEQYTASASATLDFTTRNAAGQSGATFQGDFDAYQIEFVQLIPANNANTFMMRMGTGGGPTYDTGANYGWMEFIMRAAASAIMGNEGGVSAIQLTGFNSLLSNSTLWGLSGRVILSDPLSTSAYKSVRGQTEWFYGGGPYRSISDVRGSYESTAAVTALRFYMTSGTISSGTIRLYGIAK